MSKKTPKTMVIAVRVPIEQREAIETAAVTAGASVSGFVAATMAEAMSRKKATPVTAAAPPAQVQKTQAGISLSDPAAIVELRRIGININQLAHAANAGYRRSTQACHVAIDYVRDRFKSRWRDLREAQRKEWKYVERIQANPLERAVYVFVNSERLANGKGLAGEPSRTERCQELRARSENAHGREPERSNSHVAGNDVVPADGGLVVGDVV